MAHKVFICYSSHDKQVADAACAVLEAQRISCWIAPRDILAGEEYGKSILSAISSCQVVLLIFSAHANSSPQVRREVERAVSKGKILVPFRIEEVLPSDALEYALGNTHWLDALTPPLERYLVQLCDTIGRLIYKKKITEPPLWKRTETPASPELKSDQIHEPHTKPSADRATAPTAPVISAPETISVNTNAAVAATNARESAPIEPRRRPDWTLRRSWLIMFVLFSGLLVSAVWYMRRPLPPPLVSQYQQITIDSHRKAFVGTDGTRLYFNRYADPQPLAQASVSGGKIEPIPVTLPDPWMLDISPDGSTLLIRSTDGPKHSLWSMGTLGGSLRHLTDDNVGYAAWSADGKQIAYSTVSGEVNVMRSDGSESHRLAGIASTGNFSWSLDGRFIRYTKDHRYWEMSADGSNSHPLLPGWHPNASLSDGRWTPQGFFIFASRELNSGVVSIPEAASQLWLLDERHRSFWQAPVMPVQLTSGPTGLSRPVSSKDGLTIFARGVDLHGELDSYDRKSGQIQPYLGGMSAESVTFSSDGRYVAYVGFPEGIMWRANRDGSDPMRLTDPPLYPIGLRWSPDGNQILFCALNSDGHTKSYTISAQGGAPQPILPEDNGTQSNPNWSPDGHKILFSSAEAGGLTSGPGRILDLTTHQVSSVPGSEGTRSPRWSPDGRFIAVIFGFNGLKVLDLETKRWTVLAKGQIGYPTWSRDSKYIYFLRWEGDRGVYRVHVSGGEVERVVDLKGLPLTGVFRFWMGLDPDDTPLLLRNAGKDEIYALNLAEK
ncbi:TIR domain-containing protein [Telmatobacter sp. DSM 110680]|uniref:TIR domain-containing protein n=1 Tax=Telmatobacter sp. DSM 110680 TaxID=3036704 RepID=A0AAU7DPK6_9BACT